MGHTRKPASFWRENVVAVGANVVVAKQDIITMLTFLAKNGKMKLSRESLF